MSSIEELRYLETLAYMAECALATYLQLLGRKKLVKSEIRRQRLIAWEAISVIGGSGDWGKLEMRNLPRMHAIRELYANGWNPREAFDKWCVYQGQDWS